VSTRRTSSPSWRRSRSASGRASADIPTEGIRRVEAIDIVFARELGYTIKLSDREAERRPFEARVHPTMIPNGHLLADVSATQRDLRPRRGPRSDHDYGQGAGSSRPLPR